MLENISRWNIMDFIIERENIYGKVLLSLFHYQLIFDFSIFHLNLYGLKDNLNFFPSSPPMCAEIHSYDSIP